MRGAAGNERQHTGRELLHPARDKACGRLGLIVGRDCHGASQPCGARSVSRSGRSCRVSRSPSTTDRAMSDSRWLVRRA